MRAFERRLAIATLLLFAAGRAVSASIAGLLVYLDVVHAQGYALWMTRMANQR